jgi:hypothetical protein
MMAEQLTPLPLSWVEAIYRRFSTYWGDSFVQKWKTIPFDDLMVAWSEELAGYTPAELKRGLIACKGKSFPVSFPEFLMLCRPVLTAEDALAEAIAQSQLRPGGKDKWSHPAIFWTYYGLAWEFKNLTTRELEKRWTPEFKQVMAKGTWPEIPTATTAVITHDLHVEPKTREALGKRGFDELLKQWGVKDGGD